MPVNDYWGWGYNSLCVTQWHNTYKHLYPIFELGASLKVVAVEDLSSRGGGGHFYATEGCIGHHDCWLASFEKVRGHHDCWLASFEKVRGHHDCWLASFLSRWLASIFSIAMAGQVGWRGAYIKMYARVRALYIYTSDEETNCYYRTRLQN